jgi:hypothetical protein
VAAIKQTVWFLENECKLKSIPYQAYGFFKKAIYMLLNKASNIEGKSCSGNTTSPFSTLCTARKLSFQLLRSLIA